MPISHPSMPSVPDGLHVDDLTLNTAGLVITAHTTAPPQPVRVATDPRRALTSAYWRILEDPPWQDRTVTWHLRVRRSPCGHCPGRILAEPAAGLGSRKARRSERLAEAQTDIGMVLGGEPDARSSRRPAMPVSGDTRSTDQGDRMPSRSIAQRRASPDPGRPVRALPPCPRPEPARPYHLLRRGTPAARSMQRHRSPSRGVRAGLHGRRRHRPALGRTAEVGGPGSTAFRPDPLDTPHHPVADGRSSRAAARGSRLHRRALHGATALEAGGRGYPRLRGSPASGRSRRTDTLAGGCRSR